jgi:hypothetical protein
VPVAIEWLDHGQTHADKGHTIDISPKGCLAVVPQALPVGQRLKLVNLATNSAADAVLIWKGHEGRSGWELGLELQDPPDDFWGLDF